MSSLTRTQTTDIMGNRAPAVNLAVVGSDYVNLCLPLGYHFTAVDAAIGPSPRNNYIFFRFVGGVTDITRRSRRATLLMTILEKADFKVEVNGDLVIARLTDLTKDQIADVSFT
jgi:pyruvate,water dikinase